MYPCSFNRRMRRLGCCLVLVAGSAAVVATPAPADRPPETLLQGVSKPPPPSDAPVKPRARVIAPVAAPIGTDPAGGASRGTMIMVHAGGWAGHDAHAQALLSENPGRLLRERGWRVVSIDYNEGTDGLQDVLNAAGAELTRADGDGPLCIYGESSGAHLALIAASRLRSIDCVIGLGTPTDLNLYQSEGSVSADFRVRIVASQISRFFGTAAAEIAPWDPVSLAPSIHADVMLLHEADDTVVPSTHTARFQARRATTQTVELEPGNPADASTTFIHGTISAAGRAQYASAIGSFADRAVAARDAQRSAAYTGCTRVARSIAEGGLPGLRRALGCLARQDAPSLRAGSGRWRRTSVKMRGELSAARIWASLRGTRSGRRALVAAAERRATMIVRPGDRSRVTMSATP